MAKHRSPGNIDSALFPFLSVLACVIGTLTLMIAALAIGQVAEDLQASPVDPLEREDLARDRARVRELEDRIEEERQTRDERAAVDAELRQLGIQPEDTPAAQLRAVEARLHSARLARRIERLERDHRRVYEGISGVRAELAPRAPAHDDSRAILILPHGSAGAVRPFFVECRSEGVRIYRGDLQESVYLSRASLDDAGQFRAFLQRVRSVRNSTVVFLIRPDGVPVYHWAVEQGGNLYVRHAKLPLPSQGVIEFSL